MPGPNPHNTKNTLTRGFYTRHFKKPLHPGSGLLSFDAEITLLRHAALQLSRFEPAIQSSPQAAQYKSLRSLAAATLKDLVFTQAALDLTRTAGLAVRAAVVSRVFAPRFGIFDDDGDHDLDDLENDDCLPDPLLNGLAP